MLRVKLWLISCSLLLAACGGDGNVDIDDGTLQETTNVNEDTSRLADWDTQPSILLMPPMNAKYSNEGDVVLRIHTSVQGTVDTVWIIESSMHADLDSLALVRARRMIFNPATKDGKPVSAQFYFPLKFRLR